jgi:hypothetical protein
MPLLEVSLEPRNAGSLYKLEEARNQFSPRASRSNAVLLAS